MSISTEISRIQTATNDIKTAITGKGVTVPVGSKINDLPALITSIPSGGGGSAPTMKMAYYSFEAATTSGGGTTTLDLYPLIGNDRSKLIGFNGTMQYYRTSMTTSTVNYMAMRDITAGNNGSNSIYTETDIYDFIKMNDNATTIKIPKNGLVEGHPMRMWYWYDAKTANRLMSYFKIEVYYFE